MLDVKRQVKDYITDNFLMGTSDNKVDDFTSFLDMGIIDSTGIIELVSYLEDTYNIRIDDEEIIPENLDNLINIEKYVSSKIA